MVCQLLEFSSANGYNLDKSLGAVIKQQDLSTEIQVELCQILITSGADPTSLLEVSGKYTKIAAYELIVTQRDPVLLDVCVVSHQRVLKSVQEKRRSDPVLRHQPESFFAGWESRERAREKVEG